VDIRTDCFHFRGHVPCAPHKSEGVHCPDCPHFRPRSGRILLIKLGAAGDVIRTTPLLAPLRKQYPDHALTWVTDFPDLLPAAVDDPLRLDAAAVLWLEQTPFDLVINLDKDREACALAARVTTPRRLGFTLDEHGLCRPVTDGLPAAQAAAVRDKFLTGLFDDVNQACTLSYPQEIFAICGYQFAGEPYVVDRPEPAPHFDLPAGKPVVGLNTGAGGR
jgi:heptosyltransferase-2